MQYRFKQSFSIIAVFCTVVTFFLCLVFLDHSVVYGEGNNEITVQTKVFNGQEETYVELRSVLSKLGFDIEWNDKHKIITARKDKSDIVIYTQKNTAIKNGSRMYMKDAVFISEDTAYLPLSFLHNILDMVTLPVDENNEVREITLKYNTVGYPDLQEKADVGERLDLLNPEEVAFAFINANLGFSGKVERTDIHGETARIIFIKDAEEEIHIDLYQPVKKNESGIWAVHHWFDENHHMYMAVDMSCYPEIFQYDSDIPEQLKTVLREKITVPATGVFGQWYEVQGFRTENVQYTEENGSFMLTFYLEFVTRNFYKDPDTVGYIMDAEENNSSGYETLYMEYNMSREAGLGDFQIIGRQDTEGNLIEDSLQILMLNYEGDSKTGEYKPINWESFVISN